MRWMCFAGLLAGLVALNLPARADDKPADDKAVRALIEKAVEKSGGKDKLAMLANHVLLAKGTLDVEGVPVEFTAETTYHLPGKAESKLHLETQGKKLDLVQTIDGDHGSAKINGEDKKLEGAHLAEALEEIYGQRVGQLFPLLEDKDFTLSALPEAKVEGKPASGVKVSAKGHKDLELYFDKESGLLVKSVRQTVDPRSMKEHRREIFYTDPKDAAGGPKYAGKMLVLDDGKKVAEVTVTELKFPGEVKKTP
jgi:hypothetical protein